MKIVIDKELAKDVVQEAFVNAFLKIGTLKDKSKFSAWICSIAGNIAKNTLKRKTKHNSKSIPLEMIETKVPDNLIQPGEMDNPEILYEEHEVAGKILNFIEELNTDEQMILHLKFYEGFTYMEIAKQMNIKEGTVRMKALRARGEIYKKLMIYMDMNE